MPAQKKISPSQVEVLICFMEEHRDLATGQIPDAGPVAKQNVAKLWEELATRLNKVGVGMTKSTTSWRKYWNERKYMVRKKAVDATYISRGSHLTPVRLKMTEEEERIFNIVGSLQRDSSSSIPVVNELPIQVEFKPENQERSPTPVKPQQSSLYAQESSSSEEEMEPMVLHPSTQYAQFRGDKRRYPILLQPMPQYTEKRERKRYKRRFSNSSHQSQWGSIEERIVSANERIAATLEPLTEAVVSMADSLRNLTEHVASIREMFENSSTS